MKYVYGERAKTLKDKFISLAAAMALLLSSVGMAIPTVLSQSAYATTDHSFNSTNELNKNKQVPGRVGQTAPYVELVESRVGEVELRFVNLAPGLAAFEYRIDGVIKTSGTAHPVVSGDFIYSNVSVSSGNTTLRTLQANKFVEVRLALGGERDWDFNWAAFYTAGNIVSPTAGQVIEKNNPIELEAHDYGAKNGSVQWAVKAGHGGCWGSTVAGNVDGYNTPSSWVDGVFTAIVDTTPLAPGNYCFAFNPSQGERLTRNFVVAPDTTAPQVTAVVLNSKSVNIARSQNCGPTDFNLVSGKVNLGATITDDSGVKSAVYKIRKVTDGGCTQAAIYNSSNVSMSNSGSNAWMTLTGTELDTKNVPTDGTYTIQLTVTDNENNAATHYIDILVDNTAPTVPTITAPGIRTWHRTAPILNSWSAATDQNGVLRYQVAYNYGDGHSFGSSTCPGLTMAGVTGFIGCRDVNGLSRNHSPSTSEQGKVTVWVRAIDKAGNAGSWSAPVYYYYDHEAPTTDINVSPVVHGVFTVSGSASDNQALNRTYVQLVNRETSLRCGGTTLNLIPYGATATWSQTYDLATLLSVAASPVACPAGTYAAHVSVVDMAGNSSTAGWTDNFQVAGKPDPALSAVYFTVHPDSLGVGFTVADFDDATKVEVQLYDADHNLITSNVGDSDDMVNLLNSHDGEVSSPFYIPFLSATDGYWQFGNPNWASVVPAYAKVIVTYDNGAVLEDTVDFTATNPDTGTTYTGLLANLPSNEQEEQPTGGDTGTPGGDGGTSGGTTTTSGVTTFASTASSTTPQVLGTESTTSDDQTGDQTNNQQISNALVAGATTDSQGSSTSTTDQQPKSSPFLWLGWWWILVLVSAAFLIWLFAARRAADDGR